MLTLINKEQYISFTKNYDNSNFLHSWEELERKKEQGFCVEIVGMEEGNELVAIAPLIY